MYPFRHFNPPHCSSHFSSNSIRFHRQYQKVLPLEYFSTQTQYHIPSADIAKPPFPHRTISSSSSVLIYTLLTVYTTETEQTPLTLLQQVIIFPATMYLYYAPKGLYLLLQFLIPTFFGNPICVMHSSHHHPIFQIPFFSLAFSDRNLFLPQILQQLMSPL